METQANTKVHTIDAAGKRLGRLATEVATILNGKDQADFARNLAADVRVEITNASKLDIPEGKKSEIYQTYSGHPGGRKTETLEHLGERRGYSEVVRRTIAGMLPNNKLKKVLLKNLVISE
ncbi:MAG: uL13 family ribosomal protein [Candidatus Nomurabacteria bacterium]|nr:uL13 family ribosomal protein [Candidatus Nomurabacteria bacterium]USN87922.1 MAG: uL13 family ribosomal protein [Candidatus Nomurabacteria bacterium]